MPATIAQRAFRRVSNRTETLTQVLLVGLVSTCIICLVGCDPGIEFRQTVTLRVTDTDSGEPVPNATIFFAGDGILDFYDQIFGLPTLSEAVDELDRPGVPTDENGDASLTFSVAFADSQRELDGDLVTGDQKSMLVRANDTEEMLLVTTMEGEVVVGELFTIEVISIGPVSSVTPDPPIYE